jgi:hypothetical protein
MRPVGIIRGLGGNGSTFACRALAALDGVVLLSETNPLSANLFSFALNPAQQIAANYADLGFPPYPGHMAELGMPALFGQYIRDLNARCAAIDHSIVIRDYNYVDYIGAPFIWPTVYRSSLDAALAGMPVNEVLLVRHPATQLQSLRAHEELKNALDGRSFLRGCRAMLETHAAAAMARYEDLYSAFDAGINAIAGELDLAFSADWRNRMAESGWMTGHEQGKVSLEPGAVAITIDDEVRDALKGLADYPIICEVCGYEP